MKITITSLDNIQEAAQEFLNNLGTTKFLRFMVKWELERLLSLRPFVKH